MVKIHTAVMASLILLLFLHPVRAMVTEDRWAEEGILVLRGERGEVRFSDSGKGLFLCGVGDETMQCVRIIPFCKNKDYSDSVVSLRFNSDREPADGVEAVFSTPAGGKIKARISFNAEGVLTLRPLDGMEGIRIEGDISYGILPGIFLEDIIYDPAEAGIGSELHVPSEELFVCLLGGGEGKLVCTWPEGNQEVKVLLSAGDGSPVISGVEIKLAGLDIYMGLLMHGGLWNLAEFPEDYQNRDLRTGWRRPFSATWRTELLTGSRKIRSVSRFLEETPGAVWFDSGGEGIFHLNGNQWLIDRRAFIYALEGHPDTLMGFLGRTEMAGHFAEVRKREWPFPSPGEVPFAGFHACWGTKLLIDTILKTGFQHRESNYIKAWTAAVANAAEGTQKRRIEYADFLAGQLEDINAFMEGAGGCPETALFLEKMAALAEENIKSYGALIRRDGQESPEDYIDELCELIDRLNGITRVPGNELFPEYRELATRLLNITWAQQEFTGRWGQRLREWFQEAGELCKDNPGAVEYSEAIRKSIRRFLQKRRLEVKWEERT